MSGALSIPFAALALFNVPGRILFAALAYAGVWGLVISQTREIAKLKERPGKKRDIDVYDSFGELIARGENLLAALKRNEPPLPKREEIKEVGNGLIALAETCATIEERNRLRRGFFEADSGAAITAKLNAPKEYWDDVTELVGQLQVARQIRDRIRRQCLL